MSSGQPYRRPSRNPRRGSALLAVLWLSLALSAIAFALSRSVRTEFDRAAQNVEATRAYFLAQGAIEAALTQFGGPGGAGGLEPGRRFMDFSFPGGQAQVEIIGENGKLSVRNAAPEALARVFIACNLDPVQAAGLAAQIVEARGGISGGASSFFPATTSYLQLEELLRVPGLTPDILYGTYRDGPAGLVLVGGLGPHLTFEPGGMVNINYASPQLLRAAGLPDPLILAIEQLRRQRPLKMGDPGTEVLANPDAAIRLGFGGTTMAYTLRATARLANGRTSRTVAAIAKFGVPSTQFPWDIVRWYSAAD